MAANGKDKDSGHPPARDTFFAVAWATSCIALCYSDRVIISVAVVSLRVCIVCIEHMWKRTHALLPQHLRLRPHSADKNPLNVQWLHNARTGYVVWCGYGQCACASAETMRGLTYNHADVHVR